MNILVTGGAGYIGSHCTKLLLDQGHHVFVIDNLTTGYLQAVDERAVFYNADIKEFDVVKAILKTNKIEAVIHFAAYSLVGESMENPLKYYDNNVYGTKVLLDAMIDTNTKYIVFSSSAAVYGNQPVMPLTEASPELPSNPYGETKLAMEKMMKWAHVAHGIQYIALRYFNVAGAYHTGLIGESHQPETHLIPLILQVPLGQRPSISIFGDDYDTKDGTCIRDYIHIEDLIKGHIKALEYMVQTNKSDYFNLGSGTGFSVMEIIEAARDVTKHPIPAIIASRRSGDPDKLIASYDKAKMLLDWEPKHDIKSIIKSAWKFHQQFPNGFSE